MRICMVVSVLLDIVGLSHSKHVSEYGRIREQVTWKEHMTLRLITG
jgi:hypothetical protein